MSGFLHRAIQAAWLRTDVRCLPNRVWVGYVCRSLNAVGSANSPIGIGVIRMIVGDGRRSGAVVVRKLVAVGVTAGVIIGGLAPGASADPGVGAPANPSCFGQDVSGFARAYGGIPNAAAAFDSTIQQGHNNVRNLLCGRTSGLIQKAPGA